MRRDNRVWQELAVSAVPFTPGQIEAMLHLFVGTHHETIGDLYDRLHTKAA